MNRSTFMKRENRDAEYRRLVNIHGRDRVRRKSMRNQRLHPEYVTDWEGPVERGFGNTQYDTLFSVLYIVEVRPRVDAVEAW